MDSSTTGTALSDASYSAYGEHYQENGYSGFFAANLSIYPVFTDGYAATWRLYHYDQNRWISPDPAGLSAVDPSDPQTWNRYSYARGNPLGNIDPSGLCSDYDASCTGPIFYAVGIACPNWWNIFCWLGGSHGTSPLPPSRYQTSNEGVNPNSGNPGAQSSSTGQGGGSASSSPPNTGLPLLYCQADIIAGMKKIWGQSVNGTNGTEASFNVNGSPDKYSLFFNPFTNQQLSQILRLQSSTFANFHVHPNSGSWQPSTPLNNAVGNGLGDVGMANRTGIKIYVVSRQGLGFYDPKTKLASTRLRPGMDWSKPCGK